MLDSSKCIFSFLNYLPIRDMPYQACSDQRLWLSLFLVKTSCLLLPQNSVTSLVMNLCDEEKNSVLLSQVNKAHIVIVKLLICRTVLGWLSPVLISKLKEELTVRNILNNHKLQ